MWPPDAEPEPDPESPDRPRSGRTVPGLSALLPARAFLCSLKGRLLLAASGVSFITFICYVVSSASAFLTVPLLEFLLAVYFLFADAMQLNDKWQGLCWPMMVFGFFATIVFAIDFYLIFNEVAKFLKQGDSTNETTANRTEEDNSNSDSDSD
ncbi:CKLF-like MARVEL transmembrane domain-containing protein 3 isoform X2 [Cricetulus griseus]|uniref:CKLF-like MARVEL transmembrane domain-containing protein 3 isoform X2 n=1 Tax=Cricetulus griseus TaxID=10029 RepID=UPI0004542B69|nr:CKLF-like MARVEL transmembrane domain-containing protein 3 isoform X2 [Cricetulus griseus]